MTRIAFALVLAAPLAFAAPVFAADLGAELSNAQSHAGLAASSRDLNSVHMHMHHALNCLVGPNGDGFDSKQMNPCAQSGNGAIPDESNQVKKSRLMQARDQLQTGIAATDLKAAQGAAASAQATLVSIH
jgi:hypothetical protein